MTRHPNHKSWRRECCEAEVNSLVKLLKPGHCFDCYHKWWDLMYHQTSIGTATFYYEKWWMWSWPQWLEDHGYPILRRRLQSFWQHFMKTSLMVSFQKCILHLCWNMGHYLICLLFALKESISILRKCLLLFATSRTSPNHLLEDISWDSARSKLRRKALDMKYGMPQDLVMSHQTPCLLWFWPL